MGPDSHPQQSHDLNDDVDGEPAEQSIQACSAPWPQLWSMKYKGESEMPSGTEAEGKDDPFSCQRHTTRLFLGETAGSVSRSKEAVGYTDVLADSISVAVIKLER